MKRFAQTNIFLNNPSARTLFPLRLIVNSSFTAERQLQSWKDSFFSTSVSPNKNNAVISTSQEWWGLMGECLPKYWRMLFGLRKTVSFSPAKRQCDNVTRYMKTPFVKILLVKTQSRVNTSLTLRLYSIKK